MSSRFPISIGASGGDPPPPGRPGPIVDPSSSRGIEASQPVPLQEEGLDLEFESGDELDDGTPALVAPPVQNPVLVALNAIQQGLNALFAAVGTSTQGELPNLQGFPLPAQPQVAPRPPPVARRENAPERPAHQSLRSEAHLVQPADPRPRRHTPEEPSHSAPADGGDLRRSISRPSRREEVHRALSRRAAEEDLRRSLNREDQGFDLRQSMDRGGDRMDL